MEVLIVAKTRMANAICVGGLILENNRYVRLLNPGNYNQPIDTDFEVGDVYDINFVDRTNLQPPHIEDVIIINRRFLRRINNIYELLVQRNLVDWRGHIDNLFDGLLRWTESGSGYIPENGQMPNKSVGFWIADRELTRFVFNDNKIRYHFGSYRNVTYVGFQKSLEVIPQGAIIRVSLSRLFPRQDQNFNVPRGYYLQLSGWYLNNQHNITPDIEFNENYDDYDGLPF